LPAKGVCLGRAARRSFCFASPSAFPPPTPSSRITPREIHPTPLFLSAPTSVSPPSVGGDTFFPPLVQKLFVFGFMPTGAQPHPGFRDRSFCFLAFRFDTSCVHPFESALYQSFFPPVCRSPPLFPPRCPGPLDAIAFYSFSPPSTRHPMGTPLSTIFAPRSTICFYPFPLPGPLITPHLFFGVVCSPPPFESGVDRNPRFFPCECLRVFGRTTFLPRLFTFAPYPVPPVLAPPIFFSVLATTPPGLLQHPPPSPFL